MTIPEDSLTISSSISSLRSWICYDQNNQEIKADITVEHDNQDDWHVTVKIKDEIVGTANCFYRKDGKELYVEIMRNTSKYQKVGTALHAAIANIAIQHNIKKVSLSASWTSHAFHIKTGFKPVYDLWLRKAWKEQYPHQAEEILNEDFISRFERLETFENEKGVWEKERETARNKGQFYLQDALNQYREQFREKKDLKKDEINAKLIEILGDDKKREIESKLATILCKNPDEIKLESYFPFYKNLTQKIIHTWEKIKDTSQFGGISMLLSKEKLLYYRNLFQSKS